MADKIPRASLSSLLQKPAIEPAGCALAVVDIVDCQPMLEEHILASCCDQLYPECFAWILANVRRIRPFPLRGSLGLYEVNIEELDLETEDRQEIIHRLGMAIENLAFDI